MTISPAVRSDQIIMAGSGLLLPGAAHLPAGAPVLAHNFGGLIDAVNSVTLQGGLLVPFRGIILAAAIRVRAQLGTGAALIELGTTADPDRFVSKSVPIADAAGTVYLFVDDDDFATSRIIAENTVIAASSDGGATSTGSVDAMILFAPASG